MQLYQRRESVCRTGGVQLLPFLHPTHSNVLPSSSSLSPYPSQPFSLHIPSSITLPPPLWTGVRGYYPKKFFRIYFAVFEFLRIFGAIMRFQVNGCVVINYSGLDYWLFFLITSTLTLCSIQYIIDDENENRLRDDTRWRETNNEDDTRWSETNNEDGWDLAQCQQKLNKLMKTYL